VRIDEHSDQLAAALKGGASIIVTTLQKFPFAMNHIAALAARRYAVIVDEAHSSQTGEASRQMKEVFAAGSLEAAEAEEQATTEEATADDRVAEVMRSRGKQKNLSFFAFTATPKHKTLEVFGHKDAEGKPRPFRLYSMRQAIEERFILDVLRNYTTYKAYYRLVKASEQDPRVPKSEAVKQLARFMSLHPHNVAQKTEVIIEHFRAKVRPKINGKAKAMVVTASRLHAVRYKQEFDRYIKEKGYSDLGRHECEDRELAVPRPPGSRIASVRFHPAGGRMSDVRLLAAIVYAEASASTTGPSDEMRAVAWTVRNRWLHVKTKHGDNDQRWFGSGDNVRSIIEHGQEFLGAKSPRYWMFPADPATLSEPGDRQFGLHCVTVAAEVLRAPAPTIPGRDGRFPYVWFQRGSTKPSPRASATPVYVGKHHFWSFAPDRERG